MADASRLSLCMIVRDSSRTLRSSLDGIAPWVDEMIVVDTGSRDETREIAAACGAQVFEFPWCDSFAAARNASLSHAKGDWVFWMDSDDTIDGENGRKLRELANQSLTDGASWHNMGTAHHVAGRNDLAVICYRRSLAVRPGFQPTLMQLAAAQQALNQPKFAPQAPDREAAADDSLSEPIRAPDSELELAGV